MTSAAPAPRELTADDSHAAVNAALTCAVVDADEARVQALIRQGCDVNGTDDMGLWPLLVAAKCNNLSMVRLLTDHGARSKVETTADQRTELHALAEAQKGPFPPLPATAGARLANALQGRVMPPPPIRLWQSIMFSAGASPVAPDRQGVTPFHLACARGNWPVVQFLLQGVHTPHDCKHVGEEHINKSDKHGETPLHYAARRGHAAVVSLLLSSHARAQLFNAAEAARQCGHTAVAELIEGWSYRACPILCMPYDVMLHIMALLEPHDLCSVAQVCSTLNEVSLDDHLWRRFCGQDSPAPGNASSTSSGERWKTRYMRWLQPRLKQYAASRGRVKTTEVLQAIPSKLSSNYDYMLKFNVIGDQGVGKSAIHSRFIQDKIDSQYTPTIGVEFGMKCIQVAGLQIKFQVWDTAGQERFRSITRSYYRGTHGVMVVYDITNRESLGHAKTWLADARHWLSEHNRTIPFFLIGAKADLDSQRQVTPEEGRAFAEQEGAVGWAEVSGRTGDNVTETFIRLAEAALGLDPFDSLAACPGFHVPKAGLLLELYAKASVSQQSSVLKKDQQVNCVVQ